MLAVVPDSPVALIGRGLVFRLKADYTTALAEYDRAIALDDRNAAGYAGRGLVFQSQKQIDKALVEFDRALVNNARETDALAGRDEVVVMEVERR